MQSSAEPSAPEQIALTPLFQEHYTAICAPGHPMAEKTVSINAFMKEPLLFREVSSTSYEVFQNAIRQTGCEVTPAWESTSQE
ncbi:MAG: LysR substrate-binding domain-containing protein [Clostridium fessum]